jgi:hypothetical protein
VAITYVEDADDYSPSTLGISMEAARATFPVQVEGEDMHDVIRDLLGTVEAVGNSDAGRKGGLKRGLPGAHPQWPWMYVSNIQKIQGLAFDEKVDAEDFIEVNALFVDSYAQYEKYRVVLECTPRMYAVLPDAKIETSTLSWTNEAGSTVTKTYAKEWLRFTDYDILPQPELITARLGSMCFRTGDTEPGTPPNAVAFPGHPRIVMPKAMVKFRWYQVPFSYIESSSSWITNYVGHINQHAWYGWPVGSLLYTGCTVKRYTPPVPALDDFEGVFGNEKLCDIEFQFEYTKRSLPAGATTPTLSNANWKASGHNLMPWMGSPRGFYYVTNATAPGAAVDTAKFYPTFLSFPFELLFTDPDIS